MNQSIDYHAILPETILSGTILLVLIADAFLSARRKWFTMPIGFVGTVAALVATLTLIGEDRTTFDGMFVVDGFAVLFKTFFLAVALLVLLISLRYFRDGRFYQGEYYFLLLTSFLGCLLMPSSRDLLMLFISLELVSAPGFLIAAFRKSDPRSNEAGLKFFLIGVLSTAVMLYGMSLIYGVAGSLNLGEIAAALSEPLSSGQETLVLAAILFVAFVNQHEFWTPIFAALSIATMTIGNLVALQQQQVVRLLAYSSIAQAGYMLLPFALVSSDAGVNQDAFAAAVTYILIYAIMTLGAFAVVIAMTRESRGLLISDFAGLGRRAGLLAFAMTVFMVSLAGIPPTAGFWAKFVVFGAAIERGGIGTVLAVIMIVNSVISLYYYLAVPRQMLFVEPEQDRPLVSPALVTAVTVITTVAVVAIGVWPELIARL